jgi:hypothetical protein
MNKIEIDLDKLQESGLYVYEYMILTLINENLKPFDYNWGITFEPALMTPLIQNLWMKEVEDGYELRQKGKDLFVDSKESITFDVFWDSYHTITKLPKSDREAASKYWKKLKVSEKTKAFDNVKAYYSSLSDKKYCKKCRTYLADKNFNDEFKTINKPINGASIFTFTGQD